MCVFCLSCSFFRTPSQVLFPTKDIGDLQTWYETEEGTLSTEAKSIICKTLARKRMQVCLMSSRHG